MTGSSGAGLVFLFLVDLLDLYFISLLGEQALAVAVGYAGAVVFLTVSIGIGFAIAMGVVVARAVGAGEEARARRAIAHGALVILVAAGSITALFLLFMGDILRLLGAEGQTLAYAMDFLTILLPSFPLLALAMAAGGCLRAVAAPAPAMVSTMSGALVNAILDPLLIFGLEWGLEGAAAASVGARIAVFAVAALALWRRGWIGRVHLPDLLGDVRRMARIAGPAVATNLATPVSNGIVTGAMAAQGDHAVAAYAVIGRLSVVAFGAIYALSGAVGPIIGQNAGAGNWLRVQETLAKALGFAAAVVVFSSLVMLLLRHDITAAFSLRPEAAEVVVFFTQAVSWLFVFLGAQFIANAAFNNIDRPLYSTAANWCRATLGTWPFVIAGAWLLAAPGVLLGQAVGSAVVGMISLGVAWRLVGQRVSQSGGTPLTLRRSWRARLALPPIPEHAPYRGYVGPLIGAEDADETEAAEQAAPAANRGKGA